ncbi:MAG: glycoside hydrolase family 9 protein, partial [Actinomycetota bacterium]
AVALYKATGDGTWHDTFLDIGDVDDGVDAYLSCNNHLACDAAWLYLSIDEALTDAAVRADMEASFVATADEVIAAAETTSYGWAVENRFAPLVWGLGPGGAPSAIGLLRAHRLTGDERYRRAALRSAAVSLGANPTNTVFVTGFGRHPVRNPVILDAQSGGLPVWAGTPIYGPHQVGRLDDESWIDEFVLGPAGVQPLAADLPYLWQWFDVSRVAMFNEFTVFQSHAEALYAYGLLADS